jgi:hypothetical protein
VKLKLSILFFILSIGININAQNLVMNPSFELHSTCPNSFSQINYCNSWNNGSTNSTCDYFSSLGCSGNFSPPVLTPTTYLTFYEIPLSGLSFAGFLPYFFGGNLREFIQGSFNMPLTLNKLYYIEFYINASSQQRYFIHDVAALLTDTAGLVDEYNPQNYSPQILPVSNIIYKDTVRWMRINGYYTAHGGENFITIGNYTSYGNELKDSVSSSPYKYASYFIDSVGVYAVTHLDAWSAGPDQIINVGDSVKIGNPNTDYSMFSWVTSTATQTNLTDSTDSWPYAKPTQNTTYYVTKTQGSNVFKDTVTVFVNGSGISTANNNNEVSIFPNPARDNFKIICGLQFTACSLRDVLGNTLKSIELKNKKETIDVSDLSDGVYFVCVKTLEGFITKKIIIQR